VADETKRKSLHDLSLSVFALYQDQRISRETYEDILELLKPLGDMG
jgi:hypothetical protein